VTAAAQKTMGIDAHLVSSTALDRRRSKWLTTMRIATEAEEALARMGKELEANVLRRDASKAALKAAAERSAELEKEIKALAKRREALRTDRTRAKRGVKKARRRAKVTERKFDKALLADMLRKAKSADLATNSGTAVSPRGAGNAAKSNGTPPRRATSATRRRSDPVVASTRRTAATNG
jgi:chromosome segregation ATPase